MMDFNEWVSKSINTFYKDVCLIHCWVTDENCETYEKNIKLRGFYESTLEQCLQNYVFDRFKDYDHEFNIVTDIVNKTVTLTVKTAYGVRRYCIDKAERIQDIEE